MLIPKKDIVWMRDMAMHETEDGFRFLGMFATPHLVESVIDDSHVSIWINARHSSTIGEDVFLTREECIEKEGPDQWAEELGPYSMHIDGPNMTPFGFKIPDGGYPGSSLRYYLGYPYEYGASIPWDIDDLSTFKEILEYIKQNKPEDCPLKITLCSANVFGGGSIYSFGFVDDENWYMHGVTSSSWA